MLIPLMDWHQKTMAWYHENADVYAERAQGFKPGGPWHAFVNRLQGPNVLDVGCGEGRDMRWMAKQGFVVEGVEPCAALAAKARVGGFTVHPVPFMAFQDTRKWDGIWCGGVLVHLPLSSWPGFLEKIWHMLAPGGKAFVHTKCGHGEYLDAMGRPLAMTTPVGFLNAAARLPKKALAISIQKPLPSIHETNTKHDVWQVLSLQKDSPSCAPLSAVFSQDSCETP